MIRNMSSVANDRREWRYLVVALAPPLLVGALFAFGLIIDSQAARVVDAKLDDLTPQQRPSLLKMRNRSIGRRSQFATTNDDQWFRLSFAAREIEERISSYSRSLSDTPSDELIAPDSIWPAAAVIEQILNDAAPIIDAIISTEAPGPMTESRHAIVRLLRERLRIAVYRGDHQAALETLQTMNRFTKQSDLTSNHSQYFVDALYDGIDQSLAIGFWQEPDQLDQLIALVAEPFQLSKDGEALRQRSRPFQLAYIDLLNRSQGGTRGHDNSHIPARAKLRWLDQFDEHGKTESPATLDEYGKFKSAENEPGQLSDFAITGIPHADIRSYSSGSFSWRVEAHLRNMASTEYRRWISLTLIAIKRFQLQEGRWPRTVDELYKVGVPSSQLHPKIVSHFSIRTNSDSTAAVLVRPRTIEHATSLNLTDAKQSELNYVAWWQEDSVK